LTIKTLPLAIDENGRRGSLLLAAFKTLVITGAAEAPDISKHTTGRILMLGLT
jgi:hypothetical protein